MSTKGFRNLSSYISHLESIGDLKRIKTEVSPELEITEIASRTVRDGGPALLFENVEGSDFPLVINLFGTEERVELALGRKPSDVGEELVEIFRKVNPPTIGGIFSVLPKAAGLLSMRTKKVRRGDVQQVETEPDLSRLPVIKCWPRDGGKFVTFGLVLTKDPATGSRNLGIYRLQVFDRKTTGMHWHAHKGGAAHYHEAKKLGRDLEAAVILGGDPRMIFSAVAPLPDGMDELAFASYLRRSPMPMVKGKSISLHVPAEAEFILEGSVPRDVLRQEGPFGDHFGHYSMEADFPVFNLREITHRKNPVYPAIVVGKPPQEDIYLGIAAGEMFSPLIRIIQPEVKDMWAYPEAGFHNLLAVSVDERYPKGGIKVMLALWGTGQLLLTKCMICVSSDVNPRDFTAVLNEIGENFDPREDFLMIQWAPLDTLDFTSNKFNVGSKMGINAVRKNSASRKSYAKKVPDPREKHSDITGFRLLAGGFCVVRIDESRTDPKEMIRRLFETPGLEGVRIIAVVSPDIDIMDDTELIWGIFTRFDPYLDVLFEHTELRGSAVVYDGRMGIDATVKQWYPPVIEMSEDIKDKVEARWSEYWN